MPDYRSTAGEMSDTDYLLASQLAIALNDFSAKWLEQQGSRNMQVLVAAFSIQLTTIFNTAPNYSAAQMCKHTAEYAARRFLTLINRRDPNG